MCKVNLDGSTFSTNGSSNIAMVIVLQSSNGEHVIITLQALSSVEKAEPLQVRSSEERSMWMQDGCKLYMDSWNGSCFRVTWIIFTNHLLEVGLTKPWETMALWTLTTVALFYFVMCRTHVNRHSLKLHFGWGPIQHMTSHYMIL